MAYQKNNKVISGISFRPECLAFADVVAKEDERSRSDYINRLIKEDAKRRGVDIATFFAQVGEPGKNTTPQAA